MSRVKVTYIVQCENPKSFYGFEQITNIVVFLLKIISLRDIFSKQDWLVVHWNRYWLQWLPPPCPQRDPILKLFQWKWWGSKSTVLIQGEDKSILSFSFVSFEAKLGYLVCFSQHYKSSCRGCSGAWTQIGVCVLFTCTWTFVIQNMLRVISPQLHIMVQGLKRLGVNPTWRRPDMKNMNSVRSERFIRISLQQ